VSGSTDGNNSTKGEPAARPGNAGSHDYTSAAAGRDGRAVDCTGLENQQGATLRGFESHSLRRNAIVKACDGLSVAREVLGVARQLRGLLPLRKR
jgi:hypothetical protein